MPTADVESITLADDQKTSSFSTDLKSEIDTRVSEETDENKKTGQFFYSIGTYNLLLEQGIKVENLSNIMINEVPHSPDWCKGITNIRGIIMPIVNMHSFLQTTKKKAVSTKNQKLLMLEHKNHSPIIFQIDHLPELVFIEDYSAVKTSKKTPDWLTESMSNGKTTIHITNHDTLFEQLKKF